MLGPSIVGALITLAPVEREHLPLFCRWSRDPIGMRYLGISHPLDLQEEERWYEQQVNSARDVVWVILVDGQPIGNTGLHTIDWRNRRAISGIWIGETSQHGRGYGKEAMALRTAYAFEQLNLEKVETTIMLENQASLRAAQRAGYQQCGLYRRHLFRDSHWHDVWIGEVLREEWLVARQRAE